MTKKYKKAVLPPGRTFFNDELEDFWRKNKHNFERHRIKVEDARADERAAKKAQDLPPRDFETDK